MKSYPDYYIIVRQLDGFRPIEGFANSIRQAKKWARTQYNKGFCKLEIYKRYRNYTDYNDVPCRNYNKF